MKKLTPKERKKIYSEALFMLNPKKNTGIAWLIMKALKTSSIVKMMTMNFKEWDMVLSEDKSLDTNEERFIALCFMIEIAKEPCPNK